MDAGKLAKEFILARQLSIDGHRILHWFQEGFWRWNGRIYQRLKEGLVEDQVIQWLNGKGYEYRGQRIATWTFRNLVALLRSEEPPRLMTWICPEGPEECDDHWIQAHNGIINLTKLATTGEVELRPPTPRYFNNVLLPFSFDPRATCPQWEECLLSWMENDPDRVHFLQEYVGWCLVPGTGKQRRELALFLEGEGSNGKTTFMKIFQEMLGSQNYSAVPVEAWKDQYNLYTMHDKLVNFSAETAGERAFPSHILKGMISADRITCRTLYSPPITVEPMARLVVSWNRRPKVTDNSDGFWRKIKLVPWRMKYPPKPELEDELKDELPGVFLWAVRGLGRLWSQKGFTKSQVIEDQSLLYRYENDPVRGFCSANLNLGGSVRKVELYQTFVEWVADKGQVPPTMEAFCKEVLRLYPGLTTVRRREGDSRVAYFEGVSLASPN